MNKSFTNIFQIDFAMFNNMIEESDIKFFFVTFLRLLCICNADNILLEFESFETYYSWMNFYETKYKKDAREIFSIYGMEKNDMCLNILKINVWK